MVFLVVLFVLATALDAPSARGGAIFFFFFFSLSSIWSLDFSATSADSKRTPFDREESLEALP